jgi:TusE/DsrC/DsvC family sulfur relay protein
MSTRSESQIVKVGDEHIELDAGGFMLHQQQWSIEVAEALASHRDFELTEAHWEIIRFVQEYYATYAIEPPMRALVKAVKERFGEARGNSRYLYQLFPDGPAKDACRYAGLPKPVSCI